MEIFHFVQDPGRFDEVHFIWPDLYRIMRDERSISDQTILCYSLLPKGYSGKSYTAGTWGKNASSEQ